VATLRRLLFALPVPTFVGLVANSTSLADELATNHVVSIDHVSSVPMWQYDGGQSLSPSRGACLGMGVVTGGYFARSAGFVRASTPLVVKPVATEGGMFRLGEASADGDLPRTMETVQSVSERGGVGLDGVDVRIRQQAELEGRGLFGHTPPEGTITLYPDAFSSEEQLVHTLGPERIHIRQLNIFGLRRTAKRLPPSSKLHPVPRRLVEVFPWRLLEQAVRRGCRCSLR
jgi:hypothetical protein